jgi:hypothetical protein
MKPKEELEVNHFEQPPPPHFPTEFEEIHNALIPAEGDDPNIVRSQD